MPEVAARPPVAGATPVLPADALRRHLPLGLMVASGCAALGYQIVWTQQTALWLGHEAAAVLAVIAAFFGGIAAGAYVLGPRIDRSPQPARWYAACEAAIGTWSLLLAVLMAPVARWMVDLTGTQPAPAWQWTVAFCGTFLLLLPATAAMGATLPAMERLLSQMRRDGANIAALYAGNTFGAVLGVLAAAFWLVPEIGLTRTAGVCSALNFLCAALTLKLPAADGCEPRAAPNSRAGGALFVLAVTGLLGIGYEVLVVRVLSQVAENTVYTFAMLLAVYLIGTALGAAAYDRLQACWAGQHEHLRGLLLLMLAAACAAGTIVLSGASTVKAALLAALGPGMLPALSAEAALATAAFLLPAILMGALFSHLATAARAAGVSFGQVVAVNTLGAAAAPLLFGVLLVPEIGAGLALLLVAAGYLALSTRHRRPVRAFWAMAATIPALAIWGPSLALVDVPKGGRVVSYKDGVTAAVSVVEDAGGVARLHINNQEQEGSSATLVSDSRQALLPLLLHPSPRRALFLGLGTGATASWAARDPHLDVDAVELLPEVVEASAWFRRRLDDGGNNAHLHLLTADARRFVRAMDERYDVIVSDNFHPARAGSGSLYTVEHFEAVRERLTERGLFCQWLPLHQLDLETLRSIVRTFLAVYPRAFAMLATSSLDTPLLGLVARGDGKGFSPAQVRARLATLTLPLATDRVGLTDDLAVFGSFIAGPVSLARFAGNAPLNTDDRPVVAYRAPRIAYAPDSRPRDRLAALLGDVELRPAELVASNDPAWSRRLAAYWQARNRYIDAGRDVRPSADVQVMLAQVREPLLSVLRISPDFRPAYDPLLRMATALGPIDAAAARALLTELQQIQPSRHEAGEALRDLAAPAR